MRNFGSKASTGRIFESEASLNYVKKIIHQIDKGKNPFQKYYESDSEINWGNFWGHFWEDIFSLRIKPPRDNPDRLTTREPSEVNKASF